MSEEKIAGFRNFINKLWNIGRYVSRSNNQQPKTSNSIADRWIFSRLDKIVEEVTEDLAAFRFSQAGEKLRDFTWTEFADWYVEIHKREGNDAVLREVYFMLLKLWHPFMPFVTEALWSELRQEGMLMVEDWPKSFGRHDEEAEKIMSALQDIVSAIRSVRADYKVASDKLVDVVIESPLYVEDLAPFVPVIKVLGRVKEATIAGEIMAPPQSATVAVGTNTVSVPLAELVDLEKEKRRLAEAIEETGKFIASIEGRLGNADFVAKAPEKVVEADKAKLAEARAKLEKLNVQLAAL